MRDGTRDSFALLRRLIPARSAALGRPRPVRRFLRAVHRDCRGGPAIEFAFIVPVLIILLAGIIQFGYALFIQNNMTNAAREGARSLAVGAVTASGPGGTGTHGLDQPATRRSGQRALSRSAARSAARPSPPSR